MGFQKATSATRLPQQTTFAATIKHSIQAFNASAIISSSYNSQTGGVTQSIKPRTWQWNCSLLFDSNSAGSGSLTMRLNHALRNHVARSFQLRMAHFQCQMAGGSTWCTASVHLQPNWSQRRQPVPDLLVSAVLALRHRLWISQGSEGWSNWWSR